MPYFENWCIYNKNLKLGKTNTAITRNLVYIQQESGALWPGGLVGDMGLVWLGLVEFGYVWLGMILSGQVWFGC